MLQQPGPGDLGRFRCAMPQSDCTVITRQGHNGLGYRVLRVSDHSTSSFFFAEFYVKDLETGATNPKGKPRILKETAATAWVDGGDGLGATVGNFCMDLAIKKAKESGIGWVAAKGSNHFGMAGWWAQRAEKSGYIGMAFTNSSPLLVPTRSKDGALGTNPIAMAAPASGGDSILVDMSSSAVAMGKVEVKIHEGKPLPPGWAMGPDGKMTHDPQVAFDSGRLYPLGGVEETSGYKGYCLSAMNEVFCSSLSGKSPATLGRDKTWRASKPRPGVRCHRPWLLRAWLRRTPG
ncbi:hydroxycarboxylate dehydrogenase B-like [Choristoneura fumiferana]|uniref:hydroxycarboxylate dehydrogenase B-like n=1 Tax=Choristoneura fumiferana TaxID=7141 RepID=UPI003D15D852